MLDKRLLAVASLINKAEFMCDIGTDHAYLPCYLVKNGIVKNALACDINQKPLISAQNNILKNGLSDKIKTILSDGLCNVKKEFANEIAIAGMGGEMIVKILDECPYSNDKSIHFVLQPMTKVEFLREYLCKNGYSIKREITAFDNSHFYVIMSVYYTGEKNDTDELFYDIGLIANEKNAPAKKYLEHQLYITKKIIANKSQSKNADVQHENLLCEKIESLLKGF